MKPSRIALIYGAWASEMRGPFKLDTLYSERGLTGSESCFFNMVQAFASAGHTVDAFCDIPAQEIGCASLGGANLYPVRHCATGLDYDVYISWNEPDLLRPFLHYKGLRVCAQQLNDFDYARAGYKYFVDLFIFPASVHREFMVKQCDLNPDKCEVGPNSTNWELYAPHEHATRRPKSIAWCSSPDRGLHRLLEIFPRIRQQVPDAQLRIYYRFEDWYKHARAMALPHLLGTRARYINECLNRLGRNGENGVHLIDAIGNTQMAEELSQTSVLAYTCEPIRFTEGFSVTIMDACAAGCIPVISDVDALGNLYQDSGATIIKGYPGRSLDLWIEKVVELLQAPADSLADRRQKIRDFAKGFDRTPVAGQWLELLDMHRSKAR
jgi:glycosyltransferase involved in cell wall biosynthesis